MGRCCSKYAAELELETGSLALEPQICEVAGPDSSFLSEMSLVISSPTITRLAHPLPRCHGQGLGGSSVDW